MDMNEIFGAADEKPLEHLAADGGFVGIFRRIGCVGDSLASGEFESLDGDKRSYHDMFDFSWGQYLARYAGTTAKNFSRGGMTAKEYCESFADANGFWDPALACDAYIIALGANDLFGLKQEIGSVDDIDLNDWEKNKDTFAGWYGRIIQRLKTIQPKARFFFVTFPCDSRSNDEDRAKREAHAALMYDLAKLFPFSYVIDLYHYGPDYSDPRFKEAFFLLGHMSPAGYLLSAKFIGSYMDYIIRHNFRDFVQTGFIGSPFYMENLDEKKE